MEIVEIKTRKKDYLSLLLLADEQESMIDRYLDRGTMFVLMDDGVKAECVVTDEGNGIMEIKNIATEPAYQGMGYGRSLIDFVAEKYRGQYSILQVGTGDSPLTIPFYERCGFVRSHIVINIPENIEDYLRVPFILPHRFYGDFGSFLVGKMKFPRGNAAERHAPDSVLLRHL